MNISFIVLTLYALVGAHQVLSDSEHNNDAIHQNKVTIPIELVRASEEAAHNKAVALDALVELPAAAEELKKSEREGRFLRRLHKIADFREENDLVEDPEDLGRAVRKRQRKRRRNIYGEDPLRSQRRKSPSRQGNKNSKTKKTKQGNKRRLQSSAGVRRGNKKRKANKPKKLRKPVKEEKPIEDEIQNDDLDASYEEEIHKLQIAPGEPLSLMIVEDDY